MAQFWLFEPLTGLLLDEFEPADGSWAVSVNDAEEVKVTIDLKSEREARRGWRNIATPWKTGIAVVEHGRWYGGPIMPRDWDEDEQRLEITARGFKKYLDEKIFVLPAAAATGVFINPTTKVPNAALNTVLTGWELGTIVKKLVQQACSWPGNNFPIAYEADRAGTHDRTYEALDFKPVGAAITDITEVINGPDVRFQLRQKDDTHLEWFLATGTEAQPRLQSGTIHDWDTAAIKASATGVSETSDPSEMADISFATGGRTEDTALVSRASTMTLRNAGFPVMMKLDSTHSEVKVQATLDGYASEGLRTGALEVQFRSFRARADMPPLLNEYNPGDLCRVNVEGSAYLPDGAPVRRIAALKGDAAGEWIDVTLGEVYG